jgi:pseudouridine-5'-phosphate glycosidase
MNEKTQHMEENIEKVRREKKTILYSTVGLLSGKIYIGLKLPQIYILCDT